MDVSKKVLTAIAAYDDAVKKLNNDRKILEHDEREAPRLEAELIRTIKSTGHSSARLGKRTFVIEGDRLVVEKFAGLCLADVEVRA